MRQVMIDPARTLDPSLGLVSDAQVYVPNEVGLWRTVAYLANAPWDGEHPRLSSAVGAFDVNRRSSVTRGSGEAVERFALVPVPADSEHLSVTNPCREKRIDFVGAGLGHPSALGLEFPWYRATNLVSGTQSHVPASVVDYNPGNFPEEGLAGQFFDPSPNGAAAGPSEHFAMTSAVAEIIERDAFLWAWHKRTQLKKIMVEDFPAELSGNPDARSLTRLLRTALDSGIHANLAFVPNDDGPLEIAVSVIIGDTKHGQFGAVGIKASADPISALRGALQEGLQIRELLLSRSLSPVTSHPAVTNDESRADFWMTRPAIDELRGWVQSFSKSPLPCAHPQPNVDDLVQHLARKGITSHWVSLTHRLPAAIQEIGWEAGKAICPGAFPLTMDESKRLSLVPDGFDGPPRRNAFASTPHPLI
ncbi:YcaO-like family protein [Arthrobacter sp. FW306-04-A]|uniref:YcaO-like family protein n=1 Tax=Arthrobacter sp. FW306-04-A TaxID=2879619 RepID=UPI0037C1817D|nr:YcaO-like family protein [Arthrobacter sp. FW306-04-A]